MSRILITGGAGFIGRNLARAFTASGHHVLALPKTSLNIGDRREVCTVLKAAQADAVVNAAGTKDLKGCEENSTHAMHLNGYAAAMVAEVCGEMGVKFVQIGTDHAYGSPDTAYSASKRAGDEMILHANPKALVAVTGHVYAADCPWVRWLDGELRAGRTVDAWADIFNWPTYAPNLAAMILDLLARDATGLHACVGAQRVNRHELFQWYAVAEGLDATLVVKSEAPCPSPLHPREINLPNLYAGAVRRVRVSEGMQAMCQRKAAAA